VKKTNGGNSDQNGIGDAAMEHIEDEFEEHEKHDEEHEELDDDLQPVIKKMKATLAHTQRKTKNQDQGTSVAMKKGKKKAKSTTKKKNNTTIVTRRSVTIKNTRHSKCLE
jgi:hypothetical protein